LRKPVLNVQTVRTEKMDRLEKSRCVFGNIQKMAPKWPLVANVKIGQQDQIKPSETIMAAFLISVKTLLLKKAL
jgi:hypothetical protein